MWRKEEVPDPIPAPRPEAMPLSERSIPAVPADRAIIGRSILIQGEISGDEDLLIQGRVEGSVNLRRNLVTVGSDGQVRASINGRVVIVEGRVEGDLSAEEQIILRNTAWVQGNIAAPRVVLEDGARFRGGVDMGDEVEPDRPTGEVAPAQARRARDGGRAARESLEASNQQGKRVDEAAAELVT